MARTDELAQCRVADVLFRNLGRPWLNANEFAGGLFTWGVFLGMGVAVRRDQHFRLTAVGESLSGRKRLVVESHIGPGEVRWRSNLAFPELREHQGSRGRVLARYGEARLRAMIVDLCLHAGH